MVDRGIVCVVPFETSPTGVRRFGLIARSRVGLLWSLGAWVSSSPLFSLAVRKVPGVLTPTEATGPTDERSTLPDEWRPELETLLEPNETLIAWFSPDLDPGLHFRDGLLVVTDRRVIGGRTQVGAGGGDGPGGGRA